MSDMISSIFAAILLFFLIGSSLWIFFSIIEFLYKALKCLDIYIENNNRKNDASEEL